MSWVYLQNQFVKESEALVSYKDLGLQRAYAVFDFFRVQNGRALFLKDHLDRFFYSAEQLHLKPGKTSHELKQICLELIQANKIVESGIKITLTGGFSEDGFSPGVPLILVTEQPFKKTDDQILNKGVNLVTYPYQRQLPHVKSVDYIRAISLQPYLIQQNASDLIYYTEKGITECPRANIFIVTHNGTICTPSENVLKGVTRKYAMQLALQDYPVEERQIKKEELYLAREIFITSTTKALVPVIHIDQVPIGEGKPGPVWLKLQTRWKEWVRDQT